MLSAVFSLYSPGTPYILEYSPGTPYILEYSSGYTLYTGVFFRVTPYLQEYSSGTPYILEYSPGYTLYTGVFSRYTLYTGVFFRLHLIYWSILHVTLSNWSILQVHLDTGFNTYTPVYTQINNTTDTQKSFTIDKMQKKELPRGTLKAEFQFPNRTRNTSFYIFFLEKGLGQSIYIPNE